MSAAAIFGRFWNCIIHPFVDFRTSAMLVRNASGEECVRIVRSRCGRDRFGTELGYEISSATIVLHGDRPTYEDGQFEFTNENSDLNLSKSGSIRIDRGQRRLEIQVAIAGKPWKFNGGFPYDERAA